MNRNISLDILKLSMALMVVGLHAGFLSEFSELAGFLFSQGIFRIAVPVFFIINGYYFYSTLLKNNQLFWFKRVAILYLVWMAFYSFFWFSLPDFTAISFFKLFVKIVIGYHHLWYISGMIGAAIIVILIHNKNIGFIMTCIGLTFISGVLIQYTGNYHVLPGTIFDRAFNITWIHRNFLFLSFPFFCIGFLIHKYSLEKEISVKVALFCTVLGLLFLCLESYLNYIQPLRDLGFDNYLSLIFVCPAMFILFLNQKVSGNSKSIATYSSSIYFIHSFSLILLRRFTEFEGTGLTIVAIITSAIFSVFIVSINKRAKFIL
ncbi:acyltransferase family protein [Vibrio sp. YMD68]|uniref:acyltransferase family protein n=1 Tax=Vibrio sp. YMD68 TaxID=3042300 RepID=UPI00249B6A66|nr:acyltransferase family protein [Vibrio sp. YMD68]WGV98096.1 acyltransferase family protein [Vibrio sp. YMD68]